MFAPEQQLFNPSTRTCTTCKQNIVRTHEQTLVFYHARFLTYSRKRKKPTTVCCDVISAGSEDDDALEQIHDDHTVHDMGDELKNWFDFSSAGIYF